MMLDINLFDVVGVTAVIFQHCIHWLVIFSRCHISVKNVGKITILYNLSVKNTAPFILM